ncbi:PREDICTED: coiled-coil domain-containing protein 177 [Gekko japonicus]|uniref:Coiled-coil domain-containing protein 177 n=1 Tax=Gekko japonicus TaxID=146911 RepID=A0ABM1K4X9_GEKJA|nr:PREDICTED: coiled-coil domain-containing protein 177 [Gekko japonicus]
MVDPVADPGEERCGDPGGAAGADGPPAAAMATATSSSAAAAPVCQSPTPLPAPVPPPPPPAGTGEPGQVREESPMLHLDLYNFDRPEAEGSRYVLTSPRSLEACARSAVKPVELLPRSLSELVKEAPGRSMRVAAGLYEVYEMDRQRKLQQCREERERIIREEKRRLFTPLLVGSLPSSPAARMAVRSAAAAASDGSCTPAAATPRAGCPPPPTGRKTKKSHSLDSLQKRREGFSAKTSSDSGASSSYSGDSFKDKGPKGVPRTRSVAAMSPLVGRSFSLGDLCHSPQTTKKVEKIVKEVKKKGLKEVSERDRKIAALMIARHQEESILNEQRYLSHLQWDIQRRRAEQRREQEEKEKQRALMQCKKMWESRLEKRRCKLTLEQEGVALLKQKQNLLEEQKRRQQVDKHEKMKREKLEKSALEDKQKKHHQERNLKTQEESKKEALEQEVQMLEEKQAMAAQKKLKKEQLLQKEKKLLNQAEKRKHDSLFRELARHEAEEKAVLRASLEGSLSRAQGNYEQLVEKRNQEIREKARREELQSQRAKLAAERQGKEQKEHLKALAKATERKLQHAAQVAEEVVQQKARKLVQSRLEKEKIQKVNKKKVEQCEDIRRKEILLSIEKKLERSEQIFKEKRNVLENARSVARASFHVREKVREEMNMRTFDKMAFEAEFQSGLVKK